MIMKNHEYVNWNWSIYRTLSRLIVKMLWIYFFSYEEPSPPGRAASSQIVGNIKILILQQQQKTQLIIYIIYYFPGMISSLIQG